MHFYTEHTKFGEETGRFSDGGENSFLVTSLFCLSEDAKAFACQKGQIIVVPNVESNALVNVILKPIDNLDIRFRNVAYYVYRGIRKDSILQSDTEMLEPGGTASDLIDRIYSEADFEGAYSADMVGYSNDLTDEVTIDSLFYDMDIKKMFVLEGEWFGTFNSDTSIGFEIVVDTEICPITVGYAKQGRYAVVPSGTTDFERRMSRERILAFIDPVAFWGMHSKVGVQVAGLSHKIKKTDLNTTILSHYNNESRVYIDIRSEWGYSYNVYGTYTDTLGNSIQVGTDKNNLVARTYETNSWPILWENGNNQSVFYIACVTSSDNDSKSFLFHFNDEKRRFSIIKTGRVPYSKPIQIIKDNHYGGVYQLMYVKNNEIYDFYNQCFIAPNLSEHRKFHLNCVNGKFFDTDISYVGENEIFEDEKSLLFIQNVKHACKRSGYIIPSYNIEECGGLFHEIIINDKFWNLKRKSILYKVTDSILTNDESYEIPLLQCVRSGAMHLYAENLITLGITKDEYENLLNQCELTSNHKKYFYIEPLKKNKFKFQLKIRGRSNEGKESICPQNSNIFVYSYSETVFLSLAFSKLHIAEIHLKKIKFKYHFLPKEFLEDVFDGSGKKFYYGIQEDYQTIEEAMDACARFWQIKNYPKPSQNSDYQLEKASKIYKGQTNDFRNYVTYNKVRISSVILPRTQRYTKGKDIKPIGDIHSHGSGYQLLTGKIIDNYDIFSAADIDHYERLNVIGYGFFPDGTAMKYTPNIEEYNSGGYPNGISVMPSIIEVKTNRVTCLPGKLEMFELME